MPEVMEPPGGSEKSRSWKDVSHLRMLFQFEALWFRIKGCKVKKITCYTHNDTDGLYSAVIMSDYLRHRNRVSLEYHIVNYDIINWQQKELPPDSIVLDFKYNPNAVCWIDHHDTGWGEIPKPSKCTRIVEFDPTAKSCAGLILRHLRTTKGGKHWDWQHWEELAHCADIIDSASYKSARQVITAKEDALKIRLALQAKGASELKLLQQLLDTGGDLKKVAALNQPYWEERLERIQKAISEYPKMIKILNNVGMLNLIQSFVPKDKYVPFFIEPDIDYMITLTGWKGSYQLGVGVNPWKSNIPDPVDVGQMLSVYGGGGHPAVGGVNGTDLALIFSTGQEVFRKLVNRGKANDREKGW